MSEPRDPGRKGRVTLEGACPLLSCIPAINDPTIWHTAKLFSDEPIADSLIIASELTLNSGVEVHEAMHHLKHSSLEKLQKALQ